MIQGVIYDLDNTLVDSRLDFDAIRGEMEIPPGHAILEALDSLEGNDPARAAACREILHRHELEGGQRATPLPGVIETLHAVRRRGIPQAIVTRNSRPVAEIAVESLPDLFDVVITRDDGPVKPDPWAVLQICGRWAVAPQRTVVVGDFRFDIQAGRAAGASTVLLHYGSDPDSLGGRDADMLLASLDPPEAFLDWLDAASAAS